jgi:hypothetical protein
MAVQLDKFNVDGGSSGVLVQPKLSYRFRVMMNEFGDGDTLELTSQVVSVSRPTLTHDDVIIDVYNSRINIAGKHTWDMLTLTVRDDVTGLVAKSIAAQLQKQLDHAAQSAVKAGGGYKFGMRIENLDGSQPATVLDAWHLAGCYIQNVNYGENNYATSDPLTITLAIKFDNANHIIDGAGSLDGGAGDNSIDASSAGTSGE